MMFSNQADPENNLFNTFINSEDELTVKFLYLHLNISQGY